MTNRHLSWENVKAAIDSGTPFRFPIEGEPRVEFVIEPGSTCLALVIPNNGESIPTPNIPIEAISVDRITFDEKPCIRLYTHVRPLYREFYSLMCEVADSLQLDNLSPTDAIATRLDNWKELLRGASMLSTEAQIGLLGELWTLKRLIRSRGPEAVFGWTGPSAEPHDFRLGTNELEIKSTRSRNRVHRISSIDQLQPSDGLSLYLLSLVFEPAHTDDAMSLTSLVDDIRTTLRDCSEPLRQFDKLLIAGCGYCDAHEIHYRSRFRLRLPPQIILVDEAFPRLTRQQLSKVLGSAVQKRIGDLSYSVNIESLGEPEGSDLFNQILGTVQG